MRHNMLRAEQFQRELLNEVKRDVSTLQKVNEDIGQLKESVTDLQWRSMKYNLVLMGFGGEATEEDIEAKLRNSISFELGIDWKWNLGMSTVLEK